MGVEILSDTVGKLKNMKTLHTLKNTVAENKIHSLGDTQLDGNAKALYYQIVASQAELNCEKLVDTR